MQNFAHYLNSKSHSIIFENWSSTIMAGSYFEATQAAVENTRISQVNSCSMYGI